MSDFYWMTPWLRWFAWRPVPTDEGMKWLTVVERRIGTSNGMFADKAEYRPLHPKERDHD